MVGAAQAADEGIFPAVARALKDEAAHAELTDPVDRLILTIELAFCDVRNGGPQIRQRAVQILAATRKLTNARDRFEVLSRAFPLFLATDKYDEAKDLVVKAGGAWPAIIESRGPGWKSRGIWGQFASGSFSAELVLSSTAKGEVTRCRVRVTDFHDTCMLSAALAAGGGSYERASKFVERCSSASTRLEADESIVLSYLAKNSALAKKIIEDLEGK
jgi:hypothetical protein